MAGAGVYDPFKWAAPGSGSFGYSQQGQDQFAKYQANPSQATQQTAAGTRLADPQINLPMSLPSGSGTTPKPLSGFTDYTGNAPGQLALNQNPLAATAASYGAPDAVHYDAQQLAARRQSAIANWNPTPMANPYAPGNAGLNQMKGNASAEYANQFARSRQAMQEDDGMRGITPDSGLARNQDAAMRMAEATGRAGAFGALDAENYGRASQWDTEWNRYINDARFKAAQGSDAWDQNQQDFGLRQNMNQFSQNQALMRNPLELARMGMENTGLGMQNESNRNILGYQPQMLSQAAQHGQQGLTMGDLGISDARRQDTYGVQNADLATHAYNQAKTNMSWTDAAQNLGAVQGYVGQMAKPGMDMFGAQLDATGKMMNFITGLKK